MRVNIKATNHELTPVIRKQVEDKLGGLDKYFANILNISVEIGITTRGQQKGNIYFCEVNVEVPKKLLRFRKEYENLTKAINEAKKNMQQELIKYKETQK